MDARPAFRRLLLFLYLTILLIIAKPDTVFSQVAKQNPGGYGKASYGLITAGKFMQHWWVAGPFNVTNDSIAPEDAVQEGAFKADFTANLKMVAGQPLPALLSAGNNLRWKQVSQNNDIIDLDSIFGRKDFVYAYALAEIKANQPMKVMLAVGSDDGVKVWHNGKLVHENWTPRGIEKDSDLIPLELEKGSNQILLKVQDMRGGWGFTARLLDKKSLAQQLTKASAWGALDKVKMLADHGANLNMADENGLLPVVAAKVGGRKEVVQFLLEKGTADKPVPPGETLTDQFYKSLNDKPSPGMAVLVDKDGKVLYRKGFGFANIVAKTRVTPETKFRIGSVTKQFTACAIMKLQEKGLLSVKDKLTRFIPDFPRGDEVTIHHLLTHTSGIHSYTGKAEFINRVTKTITPDSLLAFFINDPYDFNPGERYQYNNSGYFLLGYIISKVSGKSYDDFLKETFFDPLQMKNTGVHYAGIKLDKEAKGYSRNNENKFEPSLNWDMSWAGAAGAMYSTVDDLLKWNQALHNGKVLSEESYKATITPVVLNSGEQASPKYGYGLAMYKYRGVDAIGHSGGLHGFLTQLVYYPEDRITVVMFTNTSDPQVNFSPEKVAEAFLWNKMEAQTSYAVASVTPTNLEQYTGRYQLGNIGVMTFSTEGDKLYAQLTGQPKFEIFPAAEHEFFWKVVEAKVKFMKGESGVIDHAMFYQGGQELKAEKLAEEKIVEMHPSVFNQYVGKYRLDANTVVTILEENGKYYAHPNDQSRLQLHPVSENEFVIKEINARLRFEKGADNKVTKIMLNMNGGNSELPRIE